MVIVTRACDVQLHPLCGGEAVVHAERGELSTVDCACLCHVDRTPTDDDLEQLLGGQQ